MMLHLKWNTTKFGEVASYGFNSTQEGVRERTGSIESMLEMLFHFAHPRYHS